MIQSDDSEDQKIDEVERRARRAFWVAIALLKAAKSILVYEKQFWTNF